MQDLNWNDLRFILALARSESLAAASLKLGVNETTVARRIKQAEKSLKTRLFERLGGIFTPTKTGEKVIACCERVELETQNMEYTVSGVDHLVAGTVRLTTVPILLNQILVPGLKNIVSKHPDLTIELLAEPRDLSLIKRETDIALRLARPTREPGAMTRRIGRLDYAVYGRKDQNLNSMPWITYESGMKYLPQSQWIADQMKKDSSQRIVTVNDAETILASVKAGIGKSLLPIAIADTDPSLKKINSDTTVSREIWLMTHPELKKLPRIRVTMDWLVGIFEGIAIKQKDPD